MTDARVIPIATAPTQAALEDYSPARIAAYQQHVANCRESPMLDWPTHVHMETLAQCNAACNFCPYPELDRIGERMPDGLIEKIFRDLSDIPRLHSFQLSPYKVNEPFLDVRLFDIMKDAELRLPHAQLTLTSNASPITDQAIAKLARATNVKALFISFNDHRPAEYEAAMQLPYQRTIERLRSIHQAKANGWLKFDISLSRVGDGTAADRDFIAWVAEQFPLFGSLNFVRGNWLGQIGRNQLQSLPVPDKGCLRWFEISITATGKVAHCCMDGKAKWSIGDVNESHLLDIYNAPEYRQLRENTLSRLSVSPCNQCTFD